MGRTPGSPFHGDVPKPGYRSRARNASWTPRTWDGDGESGRGRRDGGAVQGVRTRDRDSWPRGLGQAARPPPPLTFLQLADPLVQGGQGALDLRPVLGVVLGAPLAFLQRVHPRQHLPLQVVDLALQQILEAVGLAGGIEAAVLLRVQGRGEATSLRAAQGPCRWRGPLRAAAGAAWRRARASGRPRGPAGWEDPGGR